MGEREICIELVGQGEPSRKAIRDFWASQIGNRLKEEVPSKKERLEILEQILEAFGSLKTERRGRLHTVQALL